MTKCNICEATTAKTSVLAEFDASGLLGTPFKVIFVDAVKERSCSRCGNVLGHIIPQPDNLIAVAAILRACDCNKLNGEEIRFLRKSLNLKSKELASRLEIDPATFSRFENGKKVMSGGHEKLLRAEVCLHHLESLNRIEVDIRGLLGMQIVSARDVSEPIEFRLIQVPNEDGSHDTKWRNKRAA